MFVESNARVIVDSVTLALIKGSTIDYVTELIVSQFAIVENPKQRAVVVDVVLAGNQFCDGILFCIDTIGMSFQCAVHCGCQRGTKRPYPRKSCD